MPYIIGSSSFATKGDITKRCQDIRDRTPDGKRVSPDDFAFLVALFRYHDEWHEKAYPGVEAISTQTNEYGNKKRGFILIHSDGTPPVDISYPYAIKLIPTGTTLTPQRLLDYKAAARTAVQDQVRDFRDSALSMVSNCPINNNRLMRGNCDVHYPAPDTFERLLFDFTLQQNIKPLTVTVDSCGAVATFHDKLLSDAWSAYHSQHANLQLVSTDGRRSLSKFPTDWKTLL